MNNSLIHSINTTLDRLSCPEVKILQHSLPPFRVCGYIGFLLGNLLTISLVLTQGVSIKFMLAINLAAVATFLSQVMLTKIMTGREQLNYYNHQIALLLVIVWLLWWLHQPILPYLDITILGLGLCLACTRAGCLMVGCCHGKPFHCGICYGKEHAEAGFTPYFVGIRLFPIQAVESLWTFCIVLVGAFLVLSNYLPGEAFSWYIATYSLGRFQFEFWRGDPDRLYWWGFSQAQWLSLFNLCILVSAGWLGILSFHWLLVGLTASLALTMIAIALKRHFHGATEYKLLHPYHVKEIAEVLERVSNLAIEKTNLSDSLPTCSNIPVVCTSLGIQISASKIKQAGNLLYLYTLSQNNGTMVEETAKVLARLIFQLQHVVNSSELIKGSRGAFHLLLPAPIEKSTIQ
jgi:Prolipoprotein diacylglyceryl transferase